LGGKGGATAKKTILIITSSFSDNIPTITRFKGVGWLDTNSLEPPTRLVLGRAGRINKLTLTITNAVVGDRNFFTGVVVDGNNKAQMSILADGVLDTRIIVYDPPEEFSATDSLNITAGVTSGTSGSMVATSALEIELD